MLLAEMVWIYFFETTLKDFFNIQILGPTKAGKPEDMSILAQTISQYDIVAIQEIRDRTGDAIALLETAVDALGIDYEYILGPRLGRSRRKEQYAFMYRTDTIELIASYTFNDNLCDVFQREPFIACFSSRSGVFDFVLVNIHVDPDDAQVEIGKLPFVVQDAQREYPGEGDFIVLGDLNADCDYWDEDQVFSMPGLESFTWIIDNSFDTNLAGSDCTYDRIISSSGVEEDYTGNSGIFDFDEHFMLNDEEAKDVSDHCPVWAEFRIDMDTD